MAIPVMNRKAGNTASVMVMASAQAGMWRRNAGVPLTPAISLTNSISQTSAPRRRSSESTRGGRSTAQILGGDAVSFAQMAAAKKEKAVVQAAGREIPISNPGKIYFPE